MDNGAGPAGPGSIGAAWELDYDSWPVREAQATTFCLGPGGTLSADRPADAARSATSPTRARGPQQTLPGDGATDAWKAQPPYDWAPIAAGKGLGFVTAPLPSDVVIAGPSSLDLQLKSSANDTDLQVTLSEVRPDGNETYVQNGWLRASHRKLDAARSTALDPVPTHLKGDAAPLPAGDVLARARADLPGRPRVPCGLAHPRDGRGVGGDRPRWDFATVDDGSTTNTVALGGPYGSSSCCRSWRERRRTARRCPRPPRCAASRTGPTPPHRTAVEFRHNRRGEEYGRPSWSGFGA